MEVDNGPTDVLVNEILSNAGVIPGNGVDVPPEVAAQDTILDVSAERERALAAIAAIKSKLTVEEDVKKDDAGVENRASETQAPVRPLKKRFGPPANAPREAPKPRKRRSRWDTDDGDTSKALIVNNGPLWPTDVTLPGGVTVVLPPHLTGRKVSDDPEIQKKYESLWSIECKLRDNKIDAPPEHERSPSPPPIYDRFGIRQNTWEARYKDKMLDKRCDLIEELIKLDKTYQPPSDYRPRKKHRKIFIPFKEYPGYNFIGLIIGPRGNTQKRMQSETNTKIAIRGRGSVKEGASRDPKYDYGEDEELHVLITGDSQEDVDLAAIMIEDLLQPQDETRNEHKRLQLRELAALNGTLKDEEEPEDQLAIVAGDKQVEGVYQLPAQIATVAQQQYERDVARMHGGPVRSSEAEYKDFLASLGGGAPGDSRGPPSFGQDRERPGLGMPGRTPRPGDDLPDDCKLYVAGLPPAFDDEILKQVFSPFGRVLHAAVIKDSATGAPRYGFVHYPDHASARAASEGMHNKCLNDDGQQRTLTVKLRSERHQTGAAGPTHYAFDESKLYVAYLPEHAQEHEIRSLFEGVAPVTEVRLITDKATGQSKGYAFVTMVTKDAASKAMQALEGYTWGETQLSIRVAGDKTTRVRPPGAPMPGRPAYPGQPVPPPHGAPPMGYSHPPPPYGHAPGPPHGMQGAPRPGPAYQPGMPPYQMPPPVPAGYGPPPGYAQPGQGYGVPPQGYAPRGYALPGYAPGYPNMPGYGHPPPGHAPPTGGYSAGYGQQPPLPSHTPPQAQPPLPGQPPLPSSDAPPLPGQPPLPPHPQPPLPGEPPQPPQPPPQVQSEYERFMSEMGKPN